MTGRAPGHVPRDTGDEWKSTSESAKAAKATPDAADEQQPAGTPEQASPTQPRAKAEDELVPLAPPADEQFVEEELPPGFWDEAPESHPPSTAPRRQAPEDPDRPAREEFSAASSRSATSTAPPRSASTAPPRSASGPARSASAPARPAAAAAPASTAEPTAAPTDAPTAAPLPAAISDPAFEKLQALFPGRVLSIEVEDEGGTGEEAASPDDSPESPDDPAEEEATDG